MSKDLVVTVSNRDILVSCTGQVNNFSFASIPVKAFPNYPPTLALFIAILCIEALKDVQDDAELWVEIERVKNNGQEN